MTDRKLKNGALIRGRVGNYLFADIRQLQLSSLKLAKRFAARDEYSLAASKLLFSQLIQFTFNPKWIVKLEKPKLFRRVGRERDVLDTAGSLSDGGRFNIGGAQASSLVIKAFPNVGNKRSALYLGEDANIVRKEYGDFGVPCSVALTYVVQLKRKKNLALIDLKLVMKDLEKLIPNIGEIVEVNSMNGKWVDLKQPTPSQILGQWLMSVAPEGTNGIRFPSSHDSKSSNICLYFNDTISCKQILSASVFNS
jgi:hypothetical protein